MISILMQQSSKVKKAKIRTTDCIRYEFIPPRFIKHIYHQHYYACKGTVYAGSLPVPLLNSLIMMHPSSPVSCSCAIYSCQSNVSSTFAEHGFEMNKATAPGLIKKRPVCLT